MPDLSRCTSRGAALADALSRDAWRFRRGQQMIGIARDERRLFGDSTVTQRRSERWVKSGTPSHADDERRMQALEARQQEWRDVTLPALEREAELMMLGYACGELGIGLWTRAEDEVVACRIAVGDIKSNSEAVDIRRRMHRRARAHGLRLEVPGLNRAG